jgi:hypothetical protein
MSPDMNPIDDIWDFIGRKVSLRNRQCRKVAELPNTVQMLALIYFFVIVYFRNRKVALIFMGVEILLL